MKRITLPDFQWLDAQPLRTKRTRLSLTSTIAPGTPPPPSGPLLLAVSDEYFDFTCCLRLQGPAEAGLVLYHTDSTFLAIGRCGQDFFTTVSVMGWRNRIDLPVSWNADPQRWMVRRRPEGAFMGWEDPDSQAVHWMGPLQLPGLQRSVSFGWYMANSSQEEASLIIDGVSYRRNP